MLIHAVSGMLPKNNLRRSRLRKMRVFLDDKHPYGDNIAFVHDQAGVKGIRHTMLTAQPVVSPVARSAAPPP